MSLHAELTNERVHRLHLHNFARVPSGASIGAAIAAMQAANQNVALVIHEDRLVGIVTDRDIMRKVVGQMSLDETVDDIMTPDPITVPPDFSAAEALWLLDRKGIRNLPVVDDQGQILGNMTHQSVLRHLADRFPQIVWNQPPDPDQMADTPEGGD